MPLLPRHLPLDQTVDFADRLILVDHARIDAILEKRIHVQLAAASRSMAQEVENAFHPTH
jgi:BMFP domain-containing protein YqiC